MIRHLPAPTDGKGRVETGAVKFGDDWTGLFIRGDNAIYLRQCIHTLLEYIGTAKLQADATLGTAAYELEEITELIGKDVLESNAR